MIFYKAVRSGDKPKAIDGFFFLAPTLKAAFMWAKTLFHDHEKYFIDAYKIPNDEFCIYNADTFVMRNGKWANNSGVNDPIRVGDLPKNLPDTAQIAVITDNPNKFDYYQVAYWDGIKLISKNKSRAAALEAQKILGQLVAIADRIREFTRNMANSLRSPGFGGIYILTEENKEVSWNVQMHTLTLRMLDETDHIIESALNVDDLSQDYINLIQGVLEDNQIVRGYVDEMLPMLIENEKLGDAEKEYTFESKPEAERFIAEMRSNDFLCGDIWRFANEEGQLCWYVSCRSKIDDGQMRRFIALSDMIDQHYNDLIFVIRDADFLE